MSDLDAIFDAVAAISVTAASKTPTVDNYDALLSSYQTAQLPRRLLMPLAGEFSGQGGVRTLAGAKQAVVWRIGDLMLWQPVGQGRAKLGEHMPALVQYCTAYSNAIANNVALLRTANQTATVEQWTLDPSVIDFGGVLYYGVEAILTIRELS